MRLICPNCDAQYEVPDNVIPQAGRDVQCSDCGNTGFQDPASATPAEPEFERQPVPPEVSTILQEEAEYERAAREHDSPPPPAPEPESQPEATSGPILQDEPEPQHPFVGPDPGETDQERRAREAGERMARMQGVAGVNPFEAADDSRKSVLPDVDALNSSLASPADAAQSIDLDDLTRRNRRASGFRTGFTLIIFVALIAVAVYMAHENLGRALPPLAPALDSYAAFVEDIRMQINHQAESLMQRLDGFVDNLGQGG